MIRTYKALVSHLTDEEGYDGDGTLASVKSFLTENGIEIDGGSVDALYERHQKALKAKAVKISIRADSPEDAYEVDTGEEKARKTDDEDEDDEDMAKAAKSLIAAIGKTAGLNSSDIKAKGSALRHDPCLGYRAFDEGGMSEYLYDVRKSAIDGQRPERLTKCLTAYDERISDGRKSLSGISGKVTATGLNTAVDADGGFLVIPEHSRELMKKVHDTGQVMSRARMLPMGSKTLSVPTINETSRVNGSRAGGVTGYWTGEAAATTKSKPTFGQVELYANTLRVGVRVTNEMIDDSAVTLGPLVSELAVSEIAFKMDDGFINGDGAGKPLGILNAPALVSFNGTGGATTVVYDDIVSMWSRLWAKSRPNAVWFINQDVEPQLMQLSANVTSSGAQIPLYLPPGGLSAAPYATLMGRPVVAIEQCATLGTIGDIILADMSQYLYGRRQDVQAAESIHVRFDNNETEFRFTMRGDGQPWWNAPLTPFKGSNTQSPFVTLTSTRT